MNTLLNALSNEMTRRVELNGGIDAVCEHYSSVYSESFASSSIRICDYLNSFCKTMEAYYAEYNDLCDILKETKKDAMYKSWLVKFEQEDHEGNYSYWEDINLPVIEALMQSEIKETELICHLCNYKGEGEGVALASTCKGLRVWQGKHESFSF